jgi:hypothetical protein
LPRNSICRLFDTHTARRILYPFAHRPVGRDDKCMCEKKV